MDKKVVEGNMLIAEFMDAEKHFGKSDGHGRWKHWYIKECGYFDTAELQYDTNWSWLMPVVEKINKVWWTEFLPNDVDEGIIEDKKNTVLLLSIASEIEVVWLAVVEFIKWYNQNQYE